MNNRLLANIRPFLSQSVQETHFYSQNRDGTHFLMQIMWSAQGSNLWLCALKSGSAHRTVGHIQNVLCIVLWEIHVQEIFRKKITEIC